MSRTQGLPPKPPVADTWRPSAPRDLQDRYTEFRPSPYGRHDDVYQFRGNENSNSSYSNERQDYQTGPPRRHDGAPVNSAADSYRPPPNDFNFRLPAPRSLDLSRTTDNYRPIPQQINQRSEYRNDNRNDRRDGKTSGVRQRPQRSDGRPRQQNPSRFAKKKTAERDILLSTRLPTPELLAGMEDDSNTTKYLAVEDLSDSDEADMDLSGSDLDPSNEENAEPKKKHARTNVSQAADGDSVPRWSNPDPYFVLPPVDESQRRSKDVVKLIRKARVTAASDEFLKAEAITDDFISFDFDDPREKLSSSDNELAAPGVAGAPTGPRGYSHRDSFHQHLSPSEVNEQNGKNNSLDSTSDPALGSRKRTLDDDIKGPPRPMKKSGKSPPASGNILREWKARPGSSPTPWCGTDHSQTAGMGNWLHKEIVDFYNHFKHKEYEDVIRDDLIIRLDRAVEREWPMCEIRPFGSFVAGLYLPTADMDLVFASSQYLKNGAPDRTCTNRRMLWNFSDFLKRSGLAAEGSIEVITKAKVPLVKYVDYRTGLRVDVSFENDTGIIANYTFKAWKDQYPAMPILVTLVKQFLAMRGLNEPVNGGIGGFSVTCLVTSLLQLMPQIQSGNMIPEHHLGEILMEFFDLYGNEFNVETTAIDLNPAGYVSKLDLQKYGHKAYNKQSLQNKFSIIDPNKPENDITGGASNTPTIRKAFSNAFIDLRNRMVELNNMPIAERRDQSILKVILGGDYSTFEVQRDHLWKCYQAKTQ